MIGEISIAGVYVPALLVLAGIALVLTGVLTRLLTLASAYRLIAYRPLVDVALFIFILGALVFATAAFGPVAP